MTYFYDGLGTLQIFGRLPADHAGGVLYVRDGPAIPSELARRLACDCVVSFNELSHGRAPAPPTSRTSRCSAPP